MAGGRECQEQEKQQEGAGGAWDGAAANGGEAERGEGGHARDCKGKERRGATAAAPLRRTALTAGAGGGRGRAAAGVCCEGNSSCTFEIRGRLPTRVGSSSSSRWLLEGGVVRSTRKCKMGQDERGMAPAAAYDILRMCHCGGGRFSCESSFLHWVRGCFCGFVL